jgi:hypothetical protein
LFSQIERALEINRLRTITAEVVETARENLVIGPYGAAPLRQIALKISDSRRGMASFRRSGASA